MTDREEFEKWFCKQLDTGYAFTSDEQITSWAWQARGELDSVRIKELEIRNAELQAQVFKTVFDDRNLNELTAKLDKAREALDRLSRLGNEPLLGNSDGNKIARMALEELNK